VTALQFSSDPASTGTGSHHTMLSLSGRVTTDNDDRQARTTHGRRAVACRIPVALDIDAQSEHSVSWAVERARRKRRFALVEQISAEHDPHPCKDDVALAIGKLSVQKNAPLGLGG
jgi:hypothetical protein